MPIGTPRFFEGDVLKYFSNPYGFFYVDIQAPEEKDLKIPLLQTKVKINNSIKTIILTIEYIIFDRCLY